MAIMPYQCYRRDSASQVLIQVIASTLNEIVKKGESGRRGDVNITMTKFHALCAPSITVPDYLKRISWYSGCSTEAFVLMIIYIDRLVTKKGIPLDALNVHRLVITSTLLAAKFFDDHYLDNAHYAAVGGLPRQELNELELEMLFLLGFNLFVTTESYNTYYNTLMNTAASRNSPSAVADMSLNSSFDAAADSAEKRHVEQTNNNNRGLVSYRPATYNRSKDSRPCRDDQSFNSSQCLVGNVPLGNRIHPDAIGFERDTAIVSHRTRDISECDSAQKPHSHFLPAGGGCLIPAKPNERSGSHVQNSGRIVPASRGSWGLQRKVNFYGN